MRLLTFRHDGQERLGALVAGDAHVVDLQRASGGEPALASMQALIAAEKPGLQQARLAIESHNRTAQAFLRPSQSNCSHRCRCPRSYAISFASRNI